MKQVIFAGLLWGAAALAANNMPSAVKNDPCLNQCQDEMRKGGRSCHSKSCFPQLIDQFKECSRACAEKRHDERMPQCKNDKGKMVPCSDLHPKKPQQ